VKRRAERALTLLEVMAAVAILGIVYAYLSKAASQGILTAGESRWRLEASLLADQELADLERATRAGVPLEAGEQDRQVDDFTVIRRIEIWTLPQELLPAPEPDAEGSSLLEGSATTPGILRRIQVVVQWFDGVHDQSIERVTFDYDASANPDLLQLAPALGAPPLDAVPGADQ